MPQVVVMEVISDNGETLNRKERFPIEPDTTVAQLRTFASTTFGKQPHHFKLIHLGTVLDDAVSLASIGIKNNSIVLLYPKHEVTVPSPSTGCSPHQNKDNIVNSMRELIKRRALHVIGRSDVQMEVLRSMPYLDCSTMSLLQNDQLLRKWINDKNQETLDRIAQEHPHLGEALKVATFCVISRDEPVVPKQSGNSYSVDALSDDSSDDEMQDQQQQQQVPRPGGSRSQGRGMRTPQQQANRLAITDEMLQAALQATYSENQVAARAFSSQLTVMREMGLTDERACVRALVRTGGDVDMAVDLLLNQ